MKCPKLERRAAGLLVGALISLSSAQAAPDACPPGGVNAPRAAVHLQGTVVGPAPPAEVERQTKIAMERSGGTPSPRYAAYPRILADYVEGGRTHRTIAAVVEGPIPRAGDKVELTMRRRDPEDPCHFIPWTATPPGLPI